MCGWTMPEATTLQLNCRHCGARLMIHIDQWATPPMGVGAADAPQLIACPVCSRTEPIQLPGPILRVTRNVDEEPTN